MGLVKRAMFEQIKSNQMLFYLAFRLLALDLMFQCHLAQKKAHFGGFIAATTINGILFIVLKQKQFVKEKYRCRALASH